MDHARAQVVITMTYFSISGLWGLQTIVTGSASVALGVLVVGYMIFDLVWIWSRPELLHIRTPVVFAHHIAAALAIVAMSVLGTARYNGYLLTLELSGFMLHALWHFRFDTAARRRLEVVNAAVWIVTRFAVPGIGVVVLYFDDVAVGTKAIVYAILFIGLMPVQIIWTITHARRGFRIQEKFALFSQDRADLALGVSEA